MRMLPCTLAHVHTHSPVTTHAPCSSRAHGHAWAVGAWAVGGMGRGGMGRGGMGCGGVDRGGVGCRGVASEGLQGLAVHSKRLAVVGGRQSRDHRPLGMIS